MIDDAKRNGEFASFCRREWTTAARADSVSGSYRATWNAAWLIASRAPSPAETLLRRYFAAMDAATRPLDDDATRTAAFVQLEGVESECRAYLARQA